MNSSAWGRARTPAVPPSSPSNSTGLCVIGNACRFGSSREATAAADSRLIKMQIDGEEVSVDRYDVRLLLGDVAAFARQNCSEEQRLVKLQECREIEEMRYEDLPRRGAFSDDLPPEKQQQQQERQWTPTLEQQQKDNRNTRPPGGAANPRDSGQASEGSGADFTAVPPPDALDPSEASSANPAHPPVSPPREGAAAGADTMKQQASVDSAEGNASLQATESEYPSRRELKHELKPHKQADEHCFVPPFPDLPKDIPLPESLREYLVVERTVHFVREEGDRMEFRLLLDEERRLPFLVASHRLHPFYLWLKQRGYSLVASAGGLLPPRIRALLTFAYSYNSASELQKQNQQNRKQELEELQADVKENLERQDEPPEVQQPPPQQQQQQHQHDPDGGLGLLLSYGSDEEDGEEREPQKQEEKQEEKQEPVSQPQKEHQKLQDFEQPRQHQDQQEQRLQETKEPLEDQPSISPVKKRPPPPPSLPSTASSAERKCDEGEGEESASDSDEASNNPKDLTSIWRSQSLTRFSLKRQKNSKARHKERMEGEDSTEDVETQLAALPKLPWALPSAKLGLSKYEDDASPYPFLWTSSMDLRYFSMRRREWVSMRRRYVLKCVETEIKKDGFVKPQPLPGPIHDLARSFLARLQLNHHLQQRKQQLLQQCMRLSEAKPEDNSMDYLKTVETAAAAAAAAATSAGSCSNTNSGESTAEAKESTQTRGTETATPGEPVADAVSTAYVATAENQLPPDPAAHLQMLLHQMAAASAENDAATYMACYSAYCYAVAALSPEAAASVATAGSSVALADTSAGSDSGRKADTQTGALERTP